MCCHHLSQPCSLKPGVVSGVFQQLSLVSCRTVKPLVGLGFVGLGLVGFLVCIGGFLSVSCLNRVLGKYCV